MTFSENGKKLERNGWRDKWMSEKHREWSTQLACVDIDCLLTKEGEVMDSEFESGWLVMECKSGSKPVAIIEHKHKNATIDRSSFNNKAIANLGTMSGLPAFIVVYDPDTTVFQVLNLNQLAIDFMGNQEPTYNERDYQEFLKALRR